MLMVKKNTSFQHFKSVFILWNFIILKHSWYLIALCLKNIKDIVIPIVLKFQKKNIQMTFYDC